MKVFHGLSEIAGQGINTVRGLKENNIDARMAVWRKSKFGYYSDIDLKIGSNKIMYPLYGMKMFAFGCKTINEYDIFHFHFGHSLLPGNYDLPMIKKRNKKIFFEFHGSELRFLFNDSKSGFLFDRRTIREKKYYQKKMRFLLKYADGVILHDIELKKFLPKEYVGPVYIVPLRVDINKLKPCYETNNTVPIIAHAPSLRSGKGTERIIDRLKTISEDYKLLLIEGKTQGEAFQLYEKADIVIDQISVGTYGVFAIEAMALGKPVITYISAEMRESFPNSLPIASARFDNIADVVGELLKNRERRETLGRQGRQYVERYHDYSKVCHYLKDIYIGTYKSNNLFELL